MATVEESVQTLEALCRCAVSLSITTQGRPASTWQLIEGSIIFARNCLTCVSLLRLIPISSFYSPIEKLDAWDLPSVASLVRNIIETYHVFFYITEEVSDAEREARVALWRFHETAERLKALQLGVPSSKGIEQLTNEYSKRRVRLERSSFFQSLPRKQRANLLNARDSKFSSQSEIAKRAGVNHNYLASCYRTLLEFYSYVADGHLHVKCLSCRNTGGTATIQVCFRGCNGFHGADHSRFRRPRSGPT